MDCEGDAHRLRTFKRFCAQLMVCALGDRGDTPTGLAINRCNCLSGFPALCGTLPMCEPDRRSGDGHCREGLAHRGAQRRVRSCGLRRKWAGTEGVCLESWLEDMVRAWFIGVPLPRLGIADLHTSGGAGQSCFSGLLIGPVRLLSESLEMSPSASVIPTCLTPLK